MVRCWNTVQMTAQYGRMPKRFSRRAKTIMAHSILIGAEARSKDAKLLQETAMAMYHLATTSNPWLGKLYASVGSLQQITMFPSWVGSWTMCGSINAWARQRSQVWLHLSQGR